MCVVESANALLGRAHAAARTQNTPNIRCEEIPATDRAARRDRPVATAVFCCVYPPRESTCLAM